MLKGKTVVITGGTTGIGAATVKLFAENHANVVFIGRKEEIGKALEEEVMNRYPDACVRYQG